MTKIPRIISVDDHVVEPPDLWTSRLPSKYADRCPRVERDSAVFNFEGGVFVYHGKHNAVLINYPDHKEKEALVK